VNRSRLVIIGFFLFILVGVVTISVFYALRTKIDASEANNSFDYEFSISSVRRLSSCEVVVITAKPLIIVKVQDSNGQGIDGISVRFQGDELNKKSEGVVAETETRSNLRGQLESGRLDFAMFEGNYWVQLVNGDEEISGVVGPLKPGFYIVENERCGEVELTDGSLLHYSYEVIFTKRQ